MSQQLIHFPGLLNSADLTALEDLIAKAGFTNGNLTATLAAKAGKGWQRLPGYKAR